MQFIERHSPRKEALIQHIEKIYAKHRAAAKAEAQPLIDQLIELTKIEIPGGYWITETPEEAAAIAARYSLATK